VERPRTSAAVQRAVVAAAGSGIPIKAVGAGHSFSAIAVAPGVLLELDDLSGLVDADAETGLATFRAGTPLHRIPKLLAPYGLAMANLGDIDRQTLAGALSTGTHGTGIRHGGLATQVRGVTLVTGTGDVIRVDQSENAELLPAAALGLGALGVLTEVTLQCVPVFALQAVERAEPLDDVLDTLLDRVRAADHVEFYWFPHTRIAATKTNRRMSADTPLARRSVVSRVVDDIVLEGGVFRATCALGVALPALIPAVNALAARLMGDGEYTDLSHRVFVSRRTVRFREMEYALPAEDVPAALREIQGMIAARRWRISFPIEVRFAAADDLWLSTAYGRETGYIAVHRYHREDPSAYFAAVEDIMRGFGARPHWGKMHTAEAAALEGLYPRFADFVRIRDRLDPRRVFANPYLSRVLGE